MKHYQDYTRSDYDADGRLLKAQEAVRRGLPRIAMFEWRKATEVLKKTTITAFCGNNVWSIQERAESDKGNKIPSLKLGNTIIR